LEGVTGLKAAFPVHYEACRCGHMSGEQFDDAFIDAYVKAVADDLPVPECALTLSFIELMGGKLRETQSPVGLKEGGEPLPHLFACLHAPRCVSVPWGCSEWPVCELTANPCWVAAAADIQWVSQIGWADPASHAVGKQYADRMAASLYPLSGKMKYINGLDLAEGERRWLRRSSVLAAC
jgi:hypothetical protein